MERFWVGLFSLLVWTMPSWAVTRYVSTMGNDTNSCAISQARGPVPSAPLMPAWPAWLGGTP